MKLDNRIIKGKKPLDCFNVDIARQFIGKKGYFGTHTSQFMNLDLCPKCVVDELKEIDEYDNSPFISAGGCCYSYFLPAEWVKEPEKKYRPFSIKDWKFKHSVGETILYRYKGTYCGDHSEAELMYLGFIKPLDGITDEAGKGQIVLGNNAHGLQNLFDDYEMWVDSDWRPFGVEIEE